MLNLHVPLFVTHELCIIMILTVQLLIWLVVLISVVLLCLVTVRSKNTRQDTEEDGTLEGKRSGAIRKWKKEEVNVESIYFDGQYVTEFLTMFTYELYCMTMCTCIILLLNLPPE